MKQHVHPSFHQHLWVDVKRALGKDLKLGSPKGGAQFGYHMPREMLPTNNFSVLRAMDKLGPADLGCAVDWVFPSAKAGDYSHMGQVYWRLVSAFDNPHDSRIGNHNIAELFGTYDGQTVVGRVHGRYSSGDPEFLNTIHLALYRRWADNPYVFRAVLSVVTGEAYESWLSREHKRVKRG